MTETHVKVTLDKCLMALLGRQELIELWWTTCNLGFKGKTPLEVYQSGEEGRQEVIGYITSFLQK